MEFLIISENKMKIMLSSDEVVRYGIESDSSDYADPEVRKAFWKILDRARDECGFKVSGNKLILQYYPSKNGAEIFVTKLGKLSVGAERTLSLSDSVAMLSSKNMIYRFDSLETLIRLSREMKKNARDLAADVYYSEDGCYYLFFEERSDAGGLSVYSVISEFAEEMPQSMAIYIKEHSEPYVLKKAFLELGAR